MEQSFPAEAAMGGTAPIKLEDDSNNNDNNNDNNNRDMNDVKVKTDDEENAMNDTTNNTTHHHAIKVDMDNDHDNGDDDDTTLVSLPAIKLEDLLPPSVKQQEEEDNNNNTVHDNGQVTTVPTDYSRVEMSGVGGGGGIQHPPAIHLDTPRTTATDATSEKRSRSKLPPTHSTTVMIMSTTTTNTTATTASTTTTATTISEFPIGKPILVSTQGNFPSLGSQLGPLFCLGRLGKGTFCSIHKCLQLHYYNNNNNDDNRDDQQPQQQQQQHRIAAAKVELETFHNSGVLDGEAVVLQHLDVSLPPGTVPKYMGYYKTATIPDATLMLSSTSQSQPSSSQQQLQQPQQPSQHACSAIVMEYLQGEDMHQLRDRVVFGRPSRRVALTDAVYLTADVMLPLLQRMHQVGVVHRDVKPSNVVRCGTTGSDRRFCMVDFGLSKSLVVPHDSVLADVEHEWHGSSWIRPPPSSGPSGASHAGSGTATTATNNTSNSMASAAAAAATINSQSAWEAPPPSSSQHTSSNGGMIHLGEDDNTKPAMAYLRKERPTAEFRGTSMYASLRVHQSKDYCPRDDMWSLLYVFCDLVSGGLPWMSHAANRDREACQKLKEKVHGDASRDQNHILLGNESPPDDETHQLLMGDLYHLAKYKRDHSKSSSTSSNKSGEEAPLPEPLAMSKDHHKVQLLRTAFAHLATLQFWDVPDYDLIQSCIKSFVDGPPSMDDPIAPISWEHFPSKPSKYRRGESTSSSISSSLLRKRVPTWNLSGRDADDWEEDLFDETEALCSNEGESGSSHPLEGDEADLARLPLEFRFRLAQMDYNTFHSRSCPMHLALRDFMNVAFPLLEGEWDSRTFEKGNHRSNSDGFRRDLYLKLLDKCLKCADHFGRFADKSWLYEQQTTPVTEDSSGQSAPASKRRKIVVTPRESRRKRKTDILEIARVITDLEIRKTAEEKKNLAPPPRLSFGSGFGMT